MKPEILKNEKRKTNFNVFKDNEKYPLVHVSRSFRAPVERVWRAWCEVELIKQWWGPVGYSAPDGRMDFREGGEYLLAMQAPDGSVVWGGGVFKEIIPNERIVWTDHFADKNGNAISPNEVGMTGEWPSELYVTIEFESIEPNLTRITLNHEGIPKEMHDDCVKGWDSSFDKLKKLVEQN